MTTIKNHDFVELEYTGRLKDGNLVFDTTDEAIAKKEGIHGHKESYGPITICVGQHHVLQGIDEQLDGKEIGEEYTLHLSPEKSFGKKDASLIQMIPMGKFTKEGIRPMPGLQVNVDSNLGMVKHAGGGRVLVDFNHPLAGQDVTYIIKVNKIVTDDTVKLKALLQFQFKVKEWDIAITDGTATIATKKLKLPAELAEPLTKYVHECIPSVHQIVITTSP